MSMSPLTRGRLDLHAEAHHTASGWHPAIIAFGQKWYWPNRTTKDELGALLDAWDSVETATDNDPRPLRAIVLEWNVYPTEGT